MEEYEDIYADEFDISENGEKAQKNKPTSPKINKSQPQKFATNKEVPKQVRATFTNQKKFTGSHAQVHDLEDKSEL